ncbi:hypothetical protein NDU88_001231 [Pleurodeles waltl]|uniref:Uncharacterized protein n=1 Tax=Pleurodeles waltl TaxID=8319 RepID=A0AAV7P655_PLEWA|nr:hypothetical protein NDU88_001231 [Pleurodeles waltl]
MDSTWGRGLATGQDGRHPVRLCRGRAIYPSKSILNAVEKERTPGASPRGLCRRCLSRVWLLSGPWGEEERQEAWRRLLSARAGFCGVRGGSGGGGHSP